MSTAPMIQPCKRFRHSAGSDSELFFLEATPARLLGMQNGNPVPGQARDLSMRAKEYWETRPSPAKPHHWTATEFAAHLRRNSYPPCTINDRMVTHGIAIRRALVKGEFVPSAVMEAEEGRAALADAIMEVKSLDEGAFRLAQQEAAASQFDAVAADPSVVQRLVVAGAKLAGLAKGFTPQPQDVVGYPRPVWCAVIDDRVVVKDTGWDFRSLYGTVHEVERAAAESFLRDALLEGELSLEDSRWFMGRDWSPFAVVHRCSSRP